MIEKKLYKMYMMLHCGLILLLLGDITTARFEERHSFVEFVPENPANFTVYCDSSPLASSFDPNTICEQENMRLFANVGRSDNVGVCNLELACNEIFKEVSSSREAIVLEILLRACLNSNQMISCRGESCITCFQNHTSQTNTPSPELTNIISSLNETTMQNNMEMYMENIQALVSAVLAQNQSLDETTSEVTTLLQTFEEEISPLLANLTNGTTLLSPDFEIVVLALNEFGDGVNENETFLVTFTGDNSEVVLHSLPDATQNVTAVVAKWNNISQFFQPLTAECNSNASCIFLPPVNASIISVSYHNMSRPNNSRIATIPVDFTSDVSRDISEVLNDVFPQDLILSIERACVWWDINLQQWSFDGCNLVPSSKFGSVECQCNHTTTFATLLSVQGANIPEWAKLIATVLESITIVLLLITILFVIVANWDKTLDNSATAGYNEGMRTNRKATQISLCTSLLGLHVTAFFILTFVDDTPSCFAAAAFLHGFLLASAASLLNEGLALIIKTHGNIGLRLNYRSLTITQVTLSWGIPILIVAISLAVYRNNYLSLSLGYVALQDKVPGLYENITGREYPKYSSCWLQIRNPSTDYPSIYTAVVPTAVIVLLNIIVLIRLIVVVYHLSKEQNNRIPCCCGKLSCSHKTMHLKAISKALFILLPMSSLPWVFWLLQSVNVWVVGLITIHIFLSGLQGFGIFVVYCLLNRTDRARVYRKWKSSKMRYMIMRLSGCCSKMIKENQHSSENINCNAIPRSSNATAVTNNNMPPHCSHS